MISPREDICIYCSDCQSQKSLLKVLSHHPNATALLGDHAVLWDFHLDVDHYTIPLFFIDTVNCFSEQDYRDADTTAIFNFMINKKMAHRYLTLRLIEYFRLVDYVYSYSGSCVNIKDDDIFRQINLCDPSRQIFSEDTMMKILGNVTIPARFFGVESNVDKVIRQGQHKNYGGNYFAWQAGLDRLFSSSLFSLITESDNGDYDKVTVFTEKTVYAMLALTVPLWPGGYRHAEMFEQMGFDIFGDLVDHSYQYEDTMFMRCWRAFEDNLELLQDLVKAKQIRQSLMPRLIQNREHLFSKKLREWYQDRMKNWPAPVKHEVYQITDLFLI